MALFWEVVPVSGSSSSKYCLQAARQTPSASQDMELGSKAAAGSSADLYIRPGSYLLQAPSLSVVLICASKTTSAFCAAALYCSRCEAGFILAAKCNLMDDEIHMSFALPEAHSMNALQCLNKTLQAQGQMKADPQITSRLTAN